MNPGRKSKPGKTRPVVVIQSSDVTESGAPSIVIVPLTSQTREENILRLRINKRDLPSLEQESDILIDQIHTVDRSLFLKELGTIPQSLMKKIMEGVQFVLGEV
ncbi:MAG: type II toxin-antitoxin system PemK/MazF family toxin [Deltaproteobacteria bacterium]|nr:type II toxin-antitoxin system PemK/MazF family toxin [Deltaproteobacteria bacterium]